MSFEEQRKAREDALRAKRRVYQKFDNYGLSHQRIDGDYQVQVVYCRFSDAWYERTRLRGVRKWSAPFKLKRKPNWVIE